MLLLAGTLLTIGGVEAVLLEVKYDYFTGGFLAVDVLRGARQILGFFASSFILDAFLILSIWTLLIPVLSRSRISRPKAFVVAGLLTPIVPFSMDYLNNELHAYFKDMMDLGLIWELSGKSPREIFAQWATQLAWFGGVAVIGICLLAAAARLSHKVVLNSGKAGWTVALPSLRTAWIATGSAGLAGVVILAGLTSFSSPIGFGLNKKPSGILLRSLAQFLTDFDRDGYGLLSQPRETVYFDARLHPYAIDMPGNGLDENGVAGDHPKDYVPGIILPDDKASWTRNPNILLVFLESFRADLTERKLNEKEITPFINSLAKEGARSLHAYSHCGYTVPSRAQLFGGRMLPFPGQTTLIDDFKSHGYQVLESGDVSEAIAIARGYKGPIHLVLMDVVLPGMKGTKVYQKIATSRPDTKVLYMSGYADNAITRQGVLDEGVHFIQKPFSMSQLLQKVFKVLNE